VVLRRAVPKRAWEDSPVRSILVAVLGAAAVTALLLESGSGLAASRSSNLSGPHQRHVFTRFPDDGIATVTIEDGTTVNMSCAGQSPVLCSPTGNGAVLSTSDLENYLAQSNVIVTTNGSGGSEVSDIDVVSPLAWSAATMLTLDADHSINVTTSMTVEGSGSTAGLSLIINDGGKKGYLTFGAGGSAVFADTKDSLSINNASYTLVDSIAGLAKGIRVNPSGNFALASNVDASGETYKHPPIQAIFFGNFEGLGNTISNLKIEDSNDANVGLFQWVSGVVENLSLASVNLVALSRRNYKVGGLAGLAERQFDTGRIPILYNDTVSGTVTAQNNHVVYMGGLVGFSGGTILAAFSSANVTADYGDGVVGGLVGFSYNVAGGLDRGTIAYSSASGAVTGELVGGLVGSSYGKILHSTASGDVTTVPGGADAGGLAGESGNVAFCSASGTVTGSPTGGGSLGGLVGNADGKVELSYATGNVLGYESLVYVGGLVGVQYIDAALENSYATGTVTCETCSGENGTLGAGGLVGETYLAVTSSYATGLVTNGGAGKKCAKGCVDGGVSGYPISGTYSFAYWDKETTGQTLCTGQGNEPGCEGRTTSQLQAKLPKGFSKGIWALDPNINNGFPYLIYNPPPP
jgi:hypothetical protein